MSGSNQTLALERQEQSLHDLASRYCWCPWPSQGALQRWLAPGLQSQAAPTFESAECRSEGVALPAVLPMLRWLIEVVERPNEL